MGVRPFCARIQEVRLKQVSVVFSILLTGLSRYDNDIGGGGADLIMQFPIEVVPVTPSGRTQTHSHT